MKQVIHVLWYLSTKRKHFIDYNTGYTALYTKNMDRKYIKTGKRI